LVRSRPIHSSAVSSFATSFHLCTAGAGCVLRFLERDGDLERAEDYAHHALLLCGSEDSGASETEAASISAQFVRLRATLGARDAAELAKLDQTVRALNNANILYHVFSLGSTAFRTLYRKLEVRH
jgi:hypothetical protein